MRKSIAKRLCNRQRGDNRREEMSGLGTTRFFARTVDRGNSRKPKEREVELNPLASQSHAENEFCPRPRPTINKMLGPCAYHISRLPFVMLALDLELREYQDRFFGLKSLLNALY
jgi:hypothetical protein